MAKTKNNGLVDLMLFNFSTTNYDMNYFAKKLFLDFGPVLDEYDHIIIDNGPGIRNLNMMMHLLFRRSVITTNLDSEAVVKTFQYMRTVAAVYSDYQLKNSPEFNIMISQVPTIEGSFEDKDLDALIGKGGKKSVQDIANKILIPMFEKLDSGNSLPNKSMYRFMGFTVYAVEDRDNALSDAGLGPTLVSDYIDFSKKNK
jgi:cellulose biosynthesis protein BcsQ